MGHKIPSQSQGPGSDQGEIDGAVKWDTTGCRYFYPAQSLVQIAPKSEDYGQLRPDRMDKYIFIKCLEYLAGLVRINFQFRDILPLKHKCHESRE